MAFGVCTKPDSIIMQRYTIDAEDKLVFWRNYGKRQNWKKPFKKYSSSWNGKAFPRLGT